MLIRKLVLGPFGVNCYLAACEETREGVIIDPGDESDRILTLIEQEKVTVKHIVNTHCHIDHVGAVEPLRKATSAPYSIHRNEEPLLHNVDQQAMMFGLQPFHVNTPDGYLNEGDFIEFGSTKLSVLETPGHSPGSLSFASDGVVFVGDLLFAGSVGRTDLVGGSFETLRKSIFQKIIPLGNETVVYCGHGPDTTIADEVNSNPFLNM